MATITQVFTVGTVAKRLGEDPELVEAIIANDDNLTYGATITVHTDTDAAILALTADGMDELKDMLKSARRTSRTWAEFLDAFVSDPEIIERVNAKAPRSQSGGHRNSPSPPEASSRPTSGDDGPCPRSQGDEEDDCQ